jgi:diguanylate cyclase (GGDEF)-like protein/PAS domain S-box-containing protein
VPSHHRQPSDPRPRVLVVSDGPLRRFRLPRALRRAAFDAPRAADHWQAEAEIRRGGWDVVVWAGGRPDLARALLAAPAPPVILAVDASCGAATVVSALEAGFADVVRSDAVPELVARVAAVLTREQARREAVDGAEGLRRLTDGSRDLLARLAPDGTILFASLAARRILGYEPERIVGASALDLCHPGDRDALERSLGGDSAGIVAHRMRLRRGGWVWMETTTSPVHDDAGRLVEVRIDARDVTELRRAEAERAGLAHVTAAVAAGDDLSAVARMASREAAGALGVETAAVARLHGDEAVVIGAVGPGLRAGDRVPLAAGPLRRVVAPVRAGTRVWGMVLALGAEAAASERLAALADLVGLAVANARSRERLVALATTDPLTGLANHRAFRERLLAECARVERTGGPLALVMIDLDRFKRINDTHGHQAGDEVLRGVARRLASCARRGDVPARVGGEELAWLLPDTGLDAAVEAAERLRLAIRGVPFRAVGRVTASLGVAVLGPDGPDDLVRRADLALYRAKEGGRDACEASTESPALRASRSG